MEISEELINVLKTSCSCLIYLIDGEYEIAFNKFIEIENSSILDNKEKKQYEMIRKYIMGIIAFVFTKSKIEDIPEIVKSKFSKIAMKEMLMDFANKKDLSQKDIDQLNSLFDI